MTAAVQLPPEPPSPDAPAAPAARGHGGRAFGALMASNLILAFGPWFVRLADVGPVASAFWRVALAAPLLALLAVRWGGPGPRPRIGGALAATMGVAGLFFAADLASWHLGIVRTRLANATLFGNTTAFFLAGYAILVARRLPGRAQGIALLLALAGTVLLFGRSYEMSAKNLAGDLMCVGAGLFYTFYLVAVGRARERLGAWPVLAAATWAAVPPLLVAVLLMGAPLAPGNWTPLLLLALGSQGVGQGLMVYAVAHLPPLVMGLGLLAQPVVASVIGILAYGERLDALDLAGGAAIAAALVLVRRGK